MRRQGLGAHPCDAPQRDGCILNQAAWQRACGHLRHREDGNRGTGQGVLHSGWGKRVWDPNSEAGHKLNGR